VDVEADALEAHLLRILACFRYQPIDIEEGGRSRDNPPAIERKGHPLALVGKELLDRETSAILFVLAKFRRGPEGTGGHGKLE
jgi:hypothetical protein